MCVVKIGVRTIIAHARLSPHHLGSALTSRFRTGAGFFFLSFFSVRKLRSLSPGD